MTNQQLGNFTDEQIRAKAHSIWLARQDSGEPGNADADWQEAINALSEKNNVQKLLKLPVTNMSRLGVVVVLSLVLIFVAFWIS